MKISNASFVDPLGENATIVYSCLAMVMSLAILLNITNCLVMMRNKDLRKHNQFFVYISISLTEAFIDALYIVLLYWRDGGVEYFCQFVFFLYALGRENIHVHLLSLCIERCFALVVTLNNIFRKMITLKGRSVAFIFSITISALITAPPIFINSVKDPYSCGPETLFENNARFVLRYFRTVFLIEIVSMLGIYLFIVKKIRTITALNVPKPAVSHSRPFIVQVKPLQSDNSSNSKTVSKGRGRKMKDFPENSNIFFTANSSATNRQIDQKPTVNSETTCKQPNHESRTQNQGGKWKPRTLKMLRSAILTTVIPSIPMLGLQTGEYFDPNFMNPSIDVVISLFNVLHAIIFPFVFIVTVKKPKCCVRNRQVDISST